MKIEIIGTGMGPILTSKKLDELFFGTSTSTINRKSPLEEAMDKLINEVKHDDEKKYKAPICFDIQAIFANHKKNAFTVVWGDGSHTIVHLQPGDVWDNEKALAMCFVKHLMGDKGSFNDIFTEEMPAKIKHLGKVEPIEENVNDNDTKAFNRTITLTEEAVDKIIKCECSPPCKECRCEAEKAAEVSVDAAPNQMGETTESTNVAMKKLIDALIEEPVKDQRYNLLLVWPNGVEKEICYNRTNIEIHRAMRAYRMKHYPALEANRTPYRLWEKDGALYVDFGVSSYFKVPGMTIDEYTRR